MDTEQYIAERINQLCEKNKISRYQLSVMTGITQSALSSIAKQKTVPTVITLDKICKALGISLSDFFAKGDDMAPDRLREDQSEILQLWETLDKDEQRFIKICMRSLKE